MKDKRVMTLKICFSAWFVFTIPMCIIPLKPSLIYILHDWIYTVLSIIAIASAVVFLLTMFVTIYLILFHTDLIIEDKEKKE